jgi:integrase
MSRRQHGEGAHYQRGKRGGRAGQWVAVADLGFREGKRDRREFTGTTSEEARRKRDGFLDRRRDGFTMPKGRQPYVSEWLLHWLHNVARRKVEATTWEGSYRQKVTELICPYFERTPLPGLCEEDIEEWHRRLESVVSKRTGRPLSASTIAQAHRIMSTALKEAVVRGKLPRNPCSNVTPPRASRAEPQPPSIDEVALILERCKTWPNGARWVLALRTGLRQGEALALEWRDVRLSPPASVTIRQSAARVRGERVVKAPKSAKSRRTIPLPAIAVTALKAHKLAQIEALLAADPGGNTAGFYVENYSSVRGEPPLPAIVPARVVSARPGAGGGGRLVFTDGAGQPVHPRADYGDWHTLLDDLSIRHYRVHDCRHAVATMLLESGTDPRVVQDIMGWSTLAMTEVYQHVRPALQQRALDALDG